jgi:hypothetical protein
MTKKKTPPEAADDAPVEALAQPAASDKPSTPSSAEYTVAFSPRQVAVGFAIVAGLVAIALRHRRSRDRRPGGD